VDAGLRLFELGLKNWSLSAKRKVAEEMGATEVKSGVSLKAEFQLDLRPLLTRISQQLDAIETQTLAIVAQMAGYTYEQAETMYVERSTEYQLEDEASRIARLVKEFTETLPLPPAAKAKLVMRWIEASNLLSLDEPVEGYASLREQLEEQIEELFAQEQQEKRAMMGALAAAQVGTAIETAPPSKYAEEPEDE
jgi:hypothetical protein